MKTTLLSLSGCLTLTLASMSMAADTKLEQAVRDIDAQWSKAAQSKDVDKTVSYYSDDATVLPANAPMANSREAIKKIWGDMIASPGFTISWKTTKVEVAKSGDLAVATGTYELTMNDATGKTMTDHGKYVEVWEKKAGTWKCGTDIWNSDLPAVPEKK